MNICTLKCVEFSKNIRYNKKRVVFEPANDTDDYTAVTAYINEEFARVKAEEEGQLFLTGGNSINENVVEKMSSQAQILLEGYSKKKREVKDNGFFCENL